MPGRPLLRRAAATAATALLALALATAPVTAHADATLDLSISAGIPMGALSPDTAGSLTDSGYSMADLDPLTGVMGAADITATLTNAYSVAADMAASDLMALDTAELARRAQAEAEARRRAQAAAGTGKLKAGAVPDAYRELVERAVTEHCPQLPVGVLAAQLEAESNWNPRAVSPVGAKGIAQFMPGTWATEGYDGNRDGRKDPFDPADAIPAAARYDCKLLDGVRNVPGDATANMLAAYNAGLGNVRKYGGVPPFKETQGYVRKILALADSKAESSSGTSPAGCPSSAPTGTLRRGAASIGVAALCERAVAQARTPQAAAAIKYALSNLGAPYSQPKRNSPGYYDCSSYLTRAYQSAGVNIAPPGRNAPTTASMRAGVPWAARISARDAKPGDFVFSAPGHVGMALTDGYWVHTNRTGDVSHVSKAPTSPFLVMRVDPTRA